MLVGALYYYVKIINYQLEDNSSPEYQEIRESMLQLYLNTMEKLVYFIMTEGW